jgi:hypothetical protein
MSTSITAALLKEFGIQPRTTATAVQTIAALVTYGSLAVQVLQDPALHKVSLEAAKDCSSAANSVARAAKSVAKVGREAAASWHRAAQSPTL